MTAPKAETRGKPATVKISSGAQRRMRQMKKMMAAKGLRRLGHKSSTSRRVTLKKTRKMLNLGPQRIPGLSRRCWRAFIHDDIEVPLKKKDSDTIKGWILQKNAGLLAEKSTLGLRIATIGYRLFTSRTPIIVLRLGWGLFYSDSNHGRDHGFAL